MYITIGMHFYTVIHIKMPSKYIIKPSKNLKYL
jgi:hypothetical protein